jgi:hypothetical protein
MVNLQDFILFMKLFGPEENSLERCRRSLYVDLTVPAPWFHGNLDDALCTELINRSNPTKGLFLMRYSSTGDAFVLHIVSEVDGHGRVARSGPNPGEHKVRINYDMKTQKYYTLGIDGKVNLQVDKVSDVIQILTNKGNISRTLPRPTEQNGSYMLVSSASPPQQSSPAPSQEDFLRLGHMCAELMKQISQKSNWCNNAFSTHGASLGQQTAATRASLAQISQATAAAGGRYQQIAGAVTLPLKDRVAHLNNLYPYLQQISNLLEPEFKRLRDAVEEKQKQREETTQGPYMYMQ